jgi:hypothetical protein
VRSRLATVGNASWRKIPLIHLCMAPLLRRQSAPPAASKCGLNESSRILATPISTVISLLASVARDRNSWLHGENSCIVWEPHRTVGLPLTNCRPANSLSKVSAKAHMVSRWSPQQSLMAATFSVGAAAQYFVSYTELPIADSGRVYCDVCRRKMIQWNSAQEPSYRLVKRPDPRGSG